jgi:hypothetical protein
MTNSTSNSQAIAFYQANLQNVTNYGLGYLTERSERQLYNAGKVLALPQLNKVVKATRKAPKAQQYDVVFDWAAKAVIETLINGGAKYITLATLYDMTEAYESEQQNAVRWATNDAKKAGSLVNTSEEGVYAVVKQQPKKVR